MTLVTGGDQSVSQLDLPGGKAGRSMNANHVTLAHTSEISAWLHCRMGRTVRVGLQVAAQSMRRPLPLSILSI